MPKSIDDAFGDIEALVARMREAATAGLATRGDARAAIANFDQARRELDAALGPVRRRLARASDADSLETLSERVPSPHPRDDER